MNVRRTNRRLAAATVATVAVAAGVAFALVDAGPATADAVAGLAHVTQTAPGTPARPILSAAEAEPFTVGNYLDWSGPYAAPVADPWRPIASHGRPDFIVGATVGVHGATHTRCRRR